MSAKQQENILFEKESQLLLLECFEKVSPWTWADRIHKTWAFEFAFSRGFHSILVEVLDPLFWGRNILSKESLLENKRYKETSKN